MEPVQIVQQDGEIHLLFNTILNVSQARALHDLLDQTLTQPMPMVLDASQIEQVDTAAMQVLASFCRQLRTQGATIRWAAVSLPLRQAGQLLGLGSLLDYPA